jgi:hypothetical protein
MTALTKNIQPPQIRDTLFSFPIAAGAKCFAGGIAVLDAAGNVKPAVTATGLIAVGRFNKYADNTNGAAGALLAEIESGVFRYDNLAADAITQAEVGDLCYLVDDQTVAKTSGTNTRSVAGRVHKFEASGVYVKLGIGLL